MSTDLAAPAFVFDQARPFVARVLDVSAGGALIQADRPLPRGSRLTVRIQADEPPVDVTAVAVVVRQCPERGERACGIRFLSLPHARQAELIRYVLYQMHARAETRPVMASPAPVTESDAAEMAALESVRNSRFHTQPTAAGNAHSGPL